MTPKHHCQSEAIKLLIVSTEHLKEKNHSPHVKENCLLSGQWKVGDNYCNDNGSSCFLRQPPLSICQLCIIHGSCHMPSKAGALVSLHGDTLRHVTSNDENTGV